MKTVYSIPIFLKVFENFCVGMFRGTYWTRTSDLCRVKAAL